MNKVGIGSRHPAFQLYEGCTALACTYMYSCPSKYSTSMGKTLNACDCQSDEFLATYVDCATRSGGDSTGAIKLLAKGCMALKSTKNVTTIMNAYQSQQNNFIEVSDIHNKSIQLTNAVYFSQTQIDNAYHSFRAIETNKYKSVLYGAALLCYFGGVFLIATLCNFTKSFAPGFAKRVSNTKPVLFIRQKIANPALGGFKHSLPYQWGPISMSPPSRSQFVILLGYTIMLFIFHFPNYDLFDGNISFTTKYLQLTKYVADRTGIIAMAQLPLLYILASRNSIIMWCTGWNFDTMNMYHRWVARSMVLDSFLHAVLFSINYRKRGSFFGHWKSYFMKWGVVAFICSCFILFFSLRFFRVSYYEFFLFSHWIFVCLFTAGTWKHLYGRGWTVWMFPCVALWAFDRACRLGRIAFSSVTSTANLELSKNKEFVKVKIDYSFTWGPNAGNYAFLYFLLPFLKFWENHPFSCYPSPLPGEEQKLCFVMKVQKGKTKQIANYLSRKDAGKVQVPVLIEGPYGHTFPVDKSDTIVLIAGGIGITATYSYATKLKKLSSKKHIILLWVTRTHGNIEVMKDEINYLVSGSDSLDVSIYVTNEEASCSPFTEKNRSDESSSDEKKSDNKSEFENEIGVPISYGTPDLTSLIVTYISQAPSSVGFFVCGPPVVNDVVRSAVTANMDKGKDRVDLFVEAFNW